MPVIYMEKSELENISEATIKEIVKENSSTDMKYAQLNDYYIGKHSILNAKKQSSSAPNNKLVNNMAKYITDVAVGYFVGKPIVYSSVDKGYQLEIQELFNYNDEQDHNTELAKKCSICGSCFEMLYVDEDVKIRFAKVDPADVIMIYETGYSSPIAAIRTVHSFDRQKKAITKVEYWDKTNVWYFTMTDGNLTLNSVEEHFWNDVPFVEYINNEERIGDFEGVLSLIDGYNKVQSNTANFFQYNDEAILKILNMGAVTATDISQMRDEGVIVLEDSGDIQWLLKEVDDAPLENYKKRLRDDMHIFSSVPNLTDDAFGGNLSGVAISYKLWSLEQICAIKERKFKRSLQRRIELITNILNTQGGHFDFTAIDMQFRRNKPQNMLEISQIITALASDVSRETRLKLLPTIDDVQDELAKLAKEQQSSIKDYGGGSYDNLSEKVDIPTKGVIPTKGGEE